MEFALPGPVSEQAVRVGHDHWQQGRERPQHQGGQEVGDEGGQIGEQLLCPLVVVVAWVVAGAGVVGRAGVGSSGQGRRADGDHAGVGFRKTSENN